MKHWLSSHAIDLLKQEGHSLNAVQFEQIFSEMKRAHTKKLMIDYTIAVLLFIGGIGALFIDLNVVGAGLLVAALWSNQNSIRHTIFAEILDVARMLSMRVNANQNQVDVEMPLKAHSPLTPQRKPNAPE